MKEHIKTRILQTNLSVKPIYFNFTSLIEVFFFRLVYDGSWMSRKVVIVKIRYIKSH